MATSANHFQQFSEVASQGWSYSRSGYLTEAEHCFALALFIDLKSMDINMALVHLKPGLCQLLKVAVKELTNREVITQSQQLKFDSANKTR